MSQATQIDKVNEQGLVVLGCGKMGSAMLKGWLDAGVQPSSAFVVDPFPSSWLLELQQQGLHLNKTLPSTAAVCVLAVKPQMMGVATPQVQALAKGQTLFVSVAAGISLDVLADTLSTRTPIVRAMPNTPAAIGKGITALIGNCICGEEHLALAEALLQAVGSTVRLTDEAQMDAVTAVSGSGPAYVFYLIECMTAAGVAQGLPEVLAANLATSTVSGAGQLAQSSSEGAAHLRKNVTSPNGTTAAALSVLMHPQDGIAPTVDQAIEAATLRSIELGKTSN
ncbi:pyrroline-5-carboxylate reductase [Polycladidibacter hongkongensis]|uniref:pyrroline-5-carboxylate reductase n=1 Tax=Polycladidibacter hongkongensis TaxID=1647556 RepID=UPI00082E1BF6|nr:pyrroline-5-carboxylate reductase [Pseudovibrio hongkongensis]